MFYSIEVNDIKIRNATQNQMVIDLTSNTIFMMAKTALDMNYIVIFNAMLTTPMSVMTIMHRNCDHAKGNCEVFLLFNKVMVTPRMVTIFGGFFIFFYKLRKLNDV